MRPQDSVFREPTKDEKDLQAKRELDRQKARKEAEELAVKCLNNEDFVRYRDKYVQLLNTTIQTLIEYNDPEPMRYAFNVRRMIDEVRQLKLLVGDVEREGKTLRK